MKILPLNSVVRLLLTSVTALLMSLDASAKETQTVKVFLLGGQSNMNGVGSEACDLAEPYNAPIPSVKLWNITGQGWSDLPLLNAVLGPEKQTRAAFGPELSFGHAIAKTFPESDIRLVKYAANGTALYDDWAPGKGKRYTAFMGEVKAALQDLTANDINYEISGMLWLQGESDAKEEMGVDYEGNLLAFIEAVRAELGSPELPFMIARVRDFYGKGRHANMVREAQAFVAELDPNVGWFDTDDCGTLVKGGHYSSDGLIEIGKRFAESYGTLGNKPVGEEVGQDDKLTIGLIGDSTVAAMYGWGPAFAARCTEHVQVLNFAKNGATLDSIPYRLDALLQRNPDFVLIQFGHNDMKVYGTDAYSDKLRAYVDKITDSGSKAIILSSVTRRNFDRVGKITPRVIQGRSLHDYARCAERLACEKKVPFIDLYARSVEHHNEIGPKRSATYNPDKRDQTHFSSQGAQAIAGLVINELNRVVPELAPYVD